MMVARHWQQRRTGRVRRRLDYANFMVLSEYHHSALMISEDSSLSSQENFRDMFVDTEGVSITPQSREESSAAETLSPSAIVVSEDCTDAVTSDMERVVQSTADIRYLERSLQCKKHGSFPTQQRIASKHVGVSCPFQVDGSLKVTTKRADAMKDEEHEQRRGTRNRKPKVPYEEESVSRKPQKKPQKKLRQLRIMRHLGLAAPHGSPFTGTCFLRTAA